jgi:hypothetical protein
VQVSVSIVNAKLFVVFLFDNYASFRSLVLGQQLGGHRSARRYDAGYGRITLADVKEEARIEHRLLRWDQHRQDPISCSSTRAFCTSGSMS